MDFLGLAMTCAPSVHPSTMAAIVQVESSFNPYAIGVVGGQLVRQPQHKAEAVATAHALEAAGYNFSVGLAQVNRFNLRRLGLSYETAFDTCPNLGAGSVILRDCYRRARRVVPREGQAIQAAISCYYSNNFQSGFDAGYVQRVVSTWQSQTQRLNSQKGGSTGARKQ